MKNDNTRNHVAMYLKKCKEEGYGLGITLSAAALPFGTYEELVKVTPWMVYMDNQETFVRAWLYGYDILKSGEEEE